MASEVLGSRPRLTPIDQAALDALVMSSPYLSPDRFSPLSALDAYRRVVALAPGSDWALPAARLAGLIGRPAEGVQILLDGAEANPLLERSEAYWLALTYQYHLLGRHEEELEAAGRAPAPATQADMHNRMFMETRALAAAGRVSELTTTYDSLGPAGVFDYRDYVVIELRAHGHRQAADELLRRVVAWNARIDLERSDRRQRLAQVAVLAGEWEEARELYDDVLASRPDDVDLRAERAFVAAKMGDLHTAREDRQWLAELPVERFFPTAAANGEHPYVRYYYLAIVDAGLGDHESAIRDVQEDTKVVSRTWAYRHLPYFESLWGDPEFLALVSPRG